MHLWGINSPVRYYIVLNEIETYLSHLYLYSLFINVANKQADKHELA